MATNLPVVRSTASYTVPSEPVTICTQSKHVYYKYKVHNKHYAECLCLVASRSVLLWQDQLASNGEQLAMTAQRFSRVDADGTGRLAILVKVYLRLSASEIPSA